METIADAALMQQYEITFDGTRYHFREFAYDKLKDAVNYAASQPRKVAATGASSSSQKVTIKTQVLGGSGWSLQTQFLYFLFVEKDFLNLQPELHGLNISIPFEALTAIEISGPGTEFRNAGVIGGGFGMAGAAIGMLTASLVNAATTQSTTNTFLRISTRDAEVFLHTSAIEPSALRMYLSPAVVKMEALRLGAQLFPPNLSTDLRELHALTQAGVLTDDEFKLAKRRLLGVV